MIVIIYRYATLINLFILISIQFCFASHEVETAPPRTQKYLTEKLKTGISQIKDSTDTYHRLRMSNEAFLLKSRSFGLWQIDSMIQTIWILERLDPFDIFLRRNKLPMLLLKAMICNKIKMITDPRPRLLSI